jgi:hypothetical protein
LFSVVMVLVCARTLAAQTQIAVNGAAPTAAVTVNAGAAVSVATASGPVNATDWVGFFPAGAADGAFIDWRYLNGTTVPPTTGVTDATITFYAPVVPDHYEFRLFASNGYNTLATSGDVVVLPSLAQVSVNGTLPPTAVSVPAGSHILVDITGGPGNAGDWIGPYAVNAADNAYVTWQYLSGTTSLSAMGSSSATLTFPGLTTAGSYEFRFFANNSVAQLATSTTVIVAASSAQLAVNGALPPTTVAVPAGSVGVVTVSGGPGNPGDWVALYPLGGADSAYVDWRYLNDTALLPADAVSSATLHFTMPTTGLV